MGLSGLVPEGEGSNWKSSEEWKAKVCPECGASLVLTHGIKRSARRRRWGALIIALLLFITAAGFFTPVALEWARVFNPAASAPTRAMALLLPTANAQDLKSMLDTIDERSLSGDISDGDLRALAHAALQRQQDATKPWDPRLGTLIEEAFDRGLISESDALAYVRAALRVDVSVPQQVFAGTLDITMQVRFDPSVADQFGSLRLRSIPIVIELEPVTVDGVQAEDNTTYPSRVILGFRPGMGSGSSRRITVPAEVKGVQVATAYTVRIDETLWDSEAFKNTKRTDAGRYGGVNVHTTDDLPTFHAHANAVQWRQPVTLPTTLLATTTLPFEEVHDQALALDAAKSFTIVMTPPRPNTREPARFRVECTTNTLPIAMLVNPGVKWNGREPEAFKSTLFYAPYRLPAGTYSTVAPNTIHLHMTPPADWDGNAPEVVMTPDLFHPESATHALRESLRRGTMLRVLVDPVTVHATLPPQPPAQPGPRR